jgi:PEGA domain
MAAIVECLWKLGQYDAALDAYDDLRREFPSLSPRMEKMLAPALAELEGLVGTLGVGGDAPAGAWILVDDRRRGTLPLTKPLRLKVGKHSVRVEKEGFEAIVADADVKPRQENVATLVARSRVGLLRVSEKHGWALDVEVDGKVAGKTPADIPVAPGDHEVRLHGYVRADAVAECAAPETGPADTQPAALDRAEMGSQKTTVAVRFYEVTPLALSADELDGALHVDATPAQAAVSVDRDGTRHGTWEGRLPLGTHTVEVTAPGFLPQKKEVSVERRKDQVVHVELAAEAKVRALRPTWSAPAGVAYGVGAAGLVVFAVTGAVALVKIDGVKSRCYPSCPTSEQANVDTAGALGTAATVGLVVAGLGAVAGSFVILLYRPPERRPGVTTGRVAWSAGVGPARFELGGRF